MIDIRPEAGGRSKVKDEVALIPKTIDIPESKQIAYFGSYRLDYRMIVLIGNKIAFAIMT